MNDEWNELGGQIKRQVVGPVGSVIFVLYFLIFLVGIGGVGHWLNIYRVLSDPSLKDGWFLALESMCVFSITLGSAAFAGTLLESERREGQEEPQPLLRILRFVYAPRREYVQWHVREVFKGYAREAI
jgi:hypothetical protein